MRGNPNNNLSLRPQSVRSQLRTGTLRAQLDAASRELEELREENARLRMDATRARSLHRVVEDMRLSTQAVVSLGGSTRANGETAAEDELDEAWGQVAQARLLQATVTAALRDLQVACTQLLRRLELGLGPMEVDRRSTERPRQQPGRTRGQGGTRDQSGTGEQNRSGNQSSNKE